MAEACDVGMIVPLAESTNQQKIEEAPATRRGFAFSGPGPPYSLPIGLPSFRAARLFNVVALMELQYQIVWWIGVREAFPSR